MRGADELHVLRHDREEIVPPLVSELGPTVRDIARLGVIRHDLARVHGILHQCRADEHGRFPVRVRERSRACLVDAGEGGAARGRVQGDAVSGRWDLRRW